MNTKHKTLKNLRIAMRFVKPHKSKIALALLFLVLNGLLKLPVPFLTMYLIDDVIPNGQFSQLLFISLLIILMSVLFIFSDYVRSYYLFVASKMVFATIQVHLLGHVQRLPISYFNSKDTGYVMSRFVNDATLLNNLVTETMVNFLQNLTIFLIGIIAVFYIHWKLALVSLLVLPFFVISNVLYGNRLRSLNTTVQEKRAFVTKSLHETLSGIFVIKAFSRERFELLRMIRYLNDSIRTELRTFFYTSKSSMLVSFIGAIGPLIVLCYGGYEIINKRLTLGQLMAFNTVLAYLYGPSQALAAIYIVTQKSLSALDRVFEVLDLEPEPGHRINQEERVTLPSRIRGDIQFKDVCFGYHSSKYTLKNINLAIESSSVVAIVGESGAGKSTLTSLILRLYDPQEGDVYIDGHNLRDLDLNSLRRHIGVVSQETFLSNISISENIRFGKRNASMEEIIRAARLANAHEFISDLPEGYDTLGGRMGFQLSAGQRQRISLARAILKDPEILILDEATSSVDSQSEELIWRALKPFVVDRTTLLISHRLSSVLQADSIVLLSQGEVLNVGSHDELIGESAYYKLYEKQLHSESGRKIVC